MSKKTKPEISARRRFFTDTAHHAGLGLLGGLLWAGYADKVRGSVLTLRPPAALPEEDFLRTCIKCGQCVEACRNRESNIDKVTGRPRPETLIMAKSDTEGVAIGTPYFIAKDVPCYMCDDIPCVPVCPSGALDEASVTNEEGELDFRKMDMGVAVVDTNSCIAFWGLQCDACYRACPLLDEAIKLKYNRNSRTGKHAFLEPVIDPDICTGCGLCERACVTEKPAIFVLPREIAQGRPGDHYVKGWVKKDQHRAGDRKASDITTHTKRSEKEAADYLNDGVSYE
jgi:ferredoxin-type protein NapG